VGVVDGTTPFGTVVKWGLTNLFDAPPTGAADPNRRTFTMDVASPTNCVNEFFKTTSFPAGHGFNQTNTGSLAAFEKRHKQLPAVAGLESDRPRTFGSAGFLSQGLRIW
jgi:hypothetical protein